MVANILILAILNSAMPNRIVLPLLQYSSLFSLLWQDNPWGALQFLLTKSLFSVSHQDPRSGLQLWTLEVNSISLLVYALCSAFVAYLYSYRFSSKSSKRSNTIHNLWFILGLAGSLCLCIGFTYITAIAHCAGPTWVGFVALYGLGFNEFQLYPAYQWALIGCGGSMCALAVYTIQSLGHKNSQPAAH